MARLEEEIDTYEQRQASLEVIKDLALKRDRIRDDLKDCEDQLGRR